MAIIIIFITITITSRDCGCSADTSSPLDKTWPPREAVLSHAPIAFAKPAPSSGPKWKLVIWGSATEPQITQLSFASRGQVVLSSSSSSMALCANGLWPCSVAVLCGPCPVAAVRGRGPWPCPMPEARGPCRLWWCSIGTALAELASHTGRRHGLMKRAYAEMIAIDYYLEARCVH